MTKNKSKQSAVAVKRPAKNETVSSNVNKVLSYWEGGAKIFVVCLVVIGASLAISVLSHDDQNLFANNHAIVNEPAVNNNQIIKKNNLFQAFSLSKTNPEPSAEKVSLPISLDIDEALDKITSEQLPEVQKQMLSDFLQGQINNTELSAEQREKMENFMNRLK